jgi:hypothetical protein
MSAMSKYPEKTTDMQSLKPCNELEILPGIKDVQLSNNSKKW